MTRYFTTYWAPDGWSAEARGAPIRAAVSNHFSARGVGRGALLYVVNVARGQVRLLGRFEVAEVTSHADAERRMGRGLYKGKEVALAAPGSATPLLERVVPGEVVRRLRFLGARGASPVKFEGPGVVDRQTLRSVRELTGESAKVLDALLAAPHGREQGADAHVLRITAAQYARALVEVDSHVSAEQREMLVGHARAAGRTLSMAQIAALGGYQSFSVASAQYGRLGRLVADALGISGLANQVQALCDSDGDANDEGHLQWTLREPVVAALRELGMLDELGDLGDKHASPGTALLDHADVANEPQTTREALVAARVGQGSYRKKMLCWWDNACALTGCGIPEALVASHALAWKDATNRERLDPFNGLPLIATVDALFDCGLVSFNDDGVLLLSHRLSANDVALAGLRPGMKLRKPLDPRQKRYLAAHRARSGLGAAEKRAARVA